jgi:hypothetical protein
MPTMEPLDTAKHRRRPYRLIHSLRLPDEQRQTAWSCESNFWLHLYGTAVHRADIRTHTRVGRRELAREGRVEMVLRRATSKSQWCRSQIYTMIYNCQGGESEVVGYCNNRSCLYRIREGQESSVAFSLCNTDTYTL